MKKLVLTLLASLAFLMILVAVYYIHINFFPIDVVFYAAIFDAALAVAVAGSGLFALPMFNLLGIFEKMLVLVIWVLTGYALAISVPTVLDRSLSFYILEKLQQRGGGILQDRFEQVFVEEYMVEYRLVDVRLTEQLQSGTILVEDDCVLLTAKGRMLATFGSYFRKNWLAKERLLMGEYSADLTDPLRNSKGGFDYGCSSTKDHSD